jgi:hypothetical protein
MIELNKTNLQNFSFTGKPQVFSLKDYVDIRDKYVDQVFKLPGVKSIYQMGSITAPGISDIDLIVVLNDDVEGVENRLYSTKPLGEKGRYIFMHPGAMIVNEATFTALPFLFHTANLHNIAGENIPQVRLTDKESELATYSILIEASIHLVHKLLKVVISQTVFIRRALLNLTAVNYSIQLAEKCGMPLKDSWQRYQEDSKGLKTQWAFRQDKIQLIKLLANGINILLEILFGIKKIFREKKIMMVEPLASNFMHSIFTSHDSALIFTDYAEQFNQVGLRSMGRTNFKIKWKQKKFSSILSIVYLPTIFYWHFKSYSNGSSWFAQSINTQFRLNKVEKFNSSIIDKQYTAILSKRVDLWCANLDFLAKHRLLNFDVMPFFLDIKRHIIRLDLTRIVRQVIPFYASLRLNQFMLRKILISVKTRVPRLSV